MKLCMVILLGAADRPVNALGDRTPLQAAAMPALTEIARSGRVGGVHAVPGSSAPSPEAAMGTLLGFPPDADLPGAGPLLAATLRRSAGPRDTVFRCDLVNLYSGAIVDPTAGSMPDAQSGPLFEYLAEALHTDGVTISAGDRWRGLLVVGEGRAEGARTRSPASCLGEPTRPNLPKGPGAALLNGLMERAAELLPSHEINSVRVDLGENPANGIWIWGGEAGTPPSAVVARSGVAVGTHPSFLGLARLAGLETKRTAVEGDTSHDLAALSKAAMKALDRSDLVVVCVDGPLHRSRMGDVEGKVRHLESVDGIVLAPILAKLESGWEGRLLVVASHVASVAKTRELPGVTPFVLSGAGAVHYGEGTFDESAAESSDLIVDRGHDLLEFAQRD